MSVYPGAQDDLPTTKTDYTGDPASAPSSAVLTAAEVNLIGSAVEAVEGELGLNPSGAAATVAARLDAVDTALGGKLSTSGTAANAAAVGGVTVTGTPTTGQVLKATSSSAATWQADATGGGGGSVTIDADGTISDGTTTIEVALDADVSALSASTTSALAGKAAAVHVHSAADVTSGTLPLARGGTGGTDAATARTNLGLGTAATQPATSFAPSASVTATLGTVSTATTGTLVAGQLAQVDATSAACARTLPAANSVAAGTVVGVKKVDTSGNAVTVSRAGADTITGTSVGQTSRALTLAGESVEFTSDGASVWVITATDTPSPALSGTYAQRSTVRDAVAQGAPLTQVPGIVGAQSFFLPATMASPPTVTSTTTNPITSPKVWQITPPAQGKTVSGVFRLYGAAWWGLIPRNQASGYSLLAANAAVGATTINLVSSVSPGTFRLGWSARRSRALNPGESGGGETVTIQSVTGSGPYVATLTSATTMPHYMDHAMTSTVTYASSGFVNGSGVAGVGSYYELGQTTVEFYTDAPTIAIMAQMNSGSTYRLTIDGQRTAATFTGSLTGGAGQPGNNGVGWLSVPFGSSAIRRIKVETTSMTLGSVHTDPKYTIWAPSEMSIKTVVVGDSFIGAGDTIARYITQTLGWPDPVYIDGVGGTGYVSDNPSNLGGIPGRYRHRLDDTLAMDPDVIFLCLSHNDPNQGTLAELATELAYCLPYLAARVKPTCKVFCVGPWGGRDGINTTKALNVPYVKAAADAAGFVYIDTCGGLGAAPNPWWYGTGTTAAPAGNGNTDLYMNADGTHPNTQGQLYIAGRIVQGALPYLGTP